MSIQSSVFHQAHTQIPLAWCERWARFLSEALEQFPEEKVPQGKLGRPLPYFPKPKERFSTDMLEGQKEGPRVVWPCLRGQSILFLSHLPQLSIHSRSQQSGESSRLLYLLDLYAEKFS